MGEVLEASLCQFCGSSDIYIVQYRKNIATQKPIYRCKGCKRRFTPDTGFKKYRFSPIIIKTAKELLDKNLSLSQVAYYLNQSFGIRVTRKTLLYWKKLDIAKKQS
jgi:transposase-like protein